MPAAGEGGFDLPMHEGSSEKPTVKYLIGKSAETSAVMAGFIATHVATMAGLWFGGARLPKFDFNTLNGQLVLGVAADPTQVFIVGGVIHYISGILWGAIFALLVSPLMSRSLKWLAPMTPTVNYMKGLLWGWILWIISSALWMPLLIDPLYGGGVVGPFLTKFGPYGVQAVLTNLFWHSIYGLNLGLLYNPMPAQR